MKSPIHYSLRFFVVAVVVATAGLAHAQPEPQTVATLPASAVGTTNATLNGIVNPNGTPTSGWFEWGTTTNYGNITSAQALGGGSGNVNFNQVVGGLVVGGTYHYRAVGSNIFAVVRGTNQSLTTPIFTDIGANLPGSSFPGSTYWEGNAAWGDYDNDGRLDFAFSATNFTTTLWQNTGLGFTNAIKIPGFIGPLSWGDYNNDGWLDLLMSGTIHRNTGGGFSSVANGILISGWAALGDYDNDGRGDVLLTGYTNSSLSPSSQVLRNTGNGFINAQAGLAGAGGLSAWADYDNDGRLDIALIGYSNSTFTTGLAQVWRNTGNGFTNINAGLPGVYRGSVAWGDYDNDSRPDLLFAGFAPGVGNIAQVWRNTGSGFTNIDAGLPGVDFSWVAWGDYDNDGRLDILITGKTNLSSQAGGTSSQLWRNTGSGFTNIPNLRLPGICGGTAAWGDYDNDGRLDILLAGYTNFNGVSASPTGAITQIWRNNSPLTNTPPLAPAGLAVSIAGQTATFSWNAASDAQTSAGGLTYNLRVGTTPGGSEIVSAMSLNSGGRLLPQTGNAQRSLSRIIFGLPFGQPIYWSVQAVDTAFAGSSFAPEKTFTFNTVFTPPNGIPIPGDIDGNGVVSQSELDTALAHYWPNSPWLYLTNVAGLGGTNVTFALSNSIAGAFSVEYSTNLSNWLLLGSAAPRYLFTDTNAPAVPQRYYRLRWP